MKRSFKYILAAAGVSFLLLLAGCGIFGEQTTPPITYKVQFVMNGWTCSEQTVAQGEYPQAVTAHVPGLVFHSWKDRQGQTVDPMTVPVTQDTRYDAVAYPALTNQAPYLFADEQGFLRPDDMLTANQLHSALSALATEEAKAYFPGMPLGDQTVSYTVLLSVMEGFFESTQVTAAFPETDAVTRSYFAQGMNRLLGRTGEQTFVLAENTHIPTDVTDIRADAVELLQAALSYTVCATGITWEQVELPVSYDPGFVNIDGWLYYVTEERRFLRDGDVGVLHFGADGRYSCGDAELDQMVADILKVLIEEKPEADRMTILRSAYDHCHTQYKYLRKPAYAFGDTGWEIEDAKEMFSGGRGNCYNFAAIFWALARGLGYEARAVSGTCTKDNQPHGWVIIELEGKDYFFDPEWQYAYADRGQPNKKNMFKIPMSDIWYWTYRWTE